MATTLESITYYLRLIAGNEKKEADGDVKQMLNYFNDMRDYQRSTTNPYIKEFEQRVEKGHSSTGLAKIVADYLLNGKTDGTPLTKAPRDGIDKKSLFLEACFESGEFIYFITWKLADSRNLSLAHDVFRKYQSDLELVRFGQQGFTLLERHHDKNNCGQCCTVCIPWRTKMERLLSKNGPYECGSFLSRSSLEENERKRKEAEYHRRNETKKAAEAAKAAAVSASTTPDSSSSDSTTPDSSSSDDSIPDYDNYTGQHDPGGWSGIGR